MSSNTSNATGGAAASGAPAASPAQPKKALVALWWVLGSFAALVLSVALFLWVFSAPFYIRLLGREVQATAYRVRDCGSTDDDGNETYQQTLLFRDAQGQLQESTSGEDCLNGQANGDKLLVWYIPSNPPDTVADGPEAIGYYIFGGFFLAVALVGLGFTVYWGRRLVIVGRREEAFTHLWLAAVACLIMLVPLLVALHFFPPPAGEQYNGPKHNYQVNDAVPVAGLWTITVQGKNLARLGSAHAADAADPVCLELDITMRNTTSQPLSLALSQFALYDAQATALTTTCSVDTPKLHDGRVAPGAALQGSLAYLVPASQHDIYLAFRPGTPQQNIGRYFWHLQATFPSTTRAVQPALV